MQVGNFTLERATWQRPEEMHTRRPVYYVATKNGAQPLASAVGRRPMCEGPDQQLLCLSCWRTAGRLSACEARCAC